MTTTTSGTYTGGTGRPTHLSDLPVDDSNSINSTTGRLIVETIPNGTTTNPGYVRIQDGTGTTIASVRQATIDGTYMADNLLETLSVGILFNSTNGDRARSASAPNLAAQSGLGVALVASPGKWSVISAPAANTQASAVRAAGGAGVRHIADAGFFTLHTATAAPAAVPLLNPVLRDGASGAGTIVLQKGMTLQLIAGFESPPENWGPGLTIPGTAATAMTAEFDATGGANTFEKATLLGWDVS